MFLGVSATVANWSTDNLECSLILDDNPLVDFVELPETCQGLYYCNVLCGVIRGALEMVSGGAVGYTLPSNMYMMIASYVPIPCAAASDLQENSRESTGSLIG